MFGVVFILGRGFGTAALATGSDLSGRVAAVFGFAGVSALFLPSLQVG